MRNANLLAVVAAVVAVMLAAATRGVADDATDDDLKALAGKWTLDRINMPDGKTIPPSKYELGADELRFNVKKGKFFIHHGNSSYPDEEYTFTIDPTQSPKRLELNGGAMTSYPAIYKFKGDDLWICYNTTHPKANEDAIERAASFKGEQVFIFKRPQ